MNSFPSMAGKQKQKSKRKKKEKEKTRLIVFYAYGNVSYT